MKKFIGALFAIGGIYLMIAGFSAATMLFGFALLVIGLIVLANKQ